MSTVTTTQNDLERFDPREVIGAAPDFLAHAFGTKPHGRTMHPLAQSIDMPTIAYAYGISNAKPGSLAATGVSPVSTIVAQGASSGGFIKALHYAAAPVVLNAYHAAADQFSFAASSVRLKIKQNQLLTVVGQFSL